MPERRGRRARHIGVAAVLATLWGADAVRAADRSCTPVPQDRIAVQLYSMVRETARKDPDAPDAGLTDRLGRTFDLLHAIGFRNLEGFGGVQGVPLAGYVAQANQSGVRFINTHDDLTSPGSFERARALGQTMVGAGGFGGPDLETLDQVIETAAALDRRGAAAAEQGLRLVVHNHAEELRQRFDYDLDGDGVAERASAWEIVAARTDPKRVSFELDIHWARIASGLDRQDALLVFLRRYRERIVLLHVKDTAADGAITDLGHGTTDWPAVFEAAGPGIAFYVWEFDGPPRPAAAGRVRPDRLRLSEVCAAKPRRGWSMIRLRFAAYLFCSNLPRPHVPCP